MQYKRHLLKKKFRGRFFLPNQNLFIKKFYCFVFYIHVYVCFMWFVSFVLYCVWDFFYWSCPNVQNRYKQFLKHYYYFFFIMANASTSSRSDFTVGGRYRLVRKIGSGSFGDIYSALNITNGEVCLYYNLFIFKCLVNC